MRHILTYSGQENVSAGPTREFILFVDRSLVTPGITALEYAHRRRKLASKLPNKGVAVIAASDIKYRSGAVFYDFHQDSNFFYLTGTVTLCTNAIFVG